LKKILWGLAAALTTPEAINAEKSLTVIVLTRAAVLVPSAGLILLALARALGA
jgi:hypothetical protein